MRIKDVLDSLVAALAGDAAIDAWCVANFTRSAKIFRGMDPNDPPRESDAPMIVVSTRERGRAEHGQFYVHGVVVSCGIVSADVVTTGNVISYAGLDLLNEFAALVETAASRNLDDQRALVDQPAEILDQVVFPWFVGHWTYLLHLRDILL